MDFEVKAEASTDPSYGTVPEKRGVTELLRKGVINLDKPEGPTSHQASAWVREILGLEKAGHAGTLDPKVSGVLPVALERSTSAVGVVSRSEKTYVALLQVHGEVDLDRLQKVLGKFRGPIFQVPPVKAAVKRERRVREVYGLEVIEVAGRFVLVEVECEAGTYIRKLCSDIGRALSTGAHMQDLRRTAVDGFEEDESVTLHELRDAHVFFEEDGEEEPIREAVQPFERMLDPLPKLLMRDTAVDAVCHGADLAAPGVSKLQPFDKGDTVALSTLKGEGVALGNALVTSDRALEMEEGLVVETFKVFMEPGTYPKGW